MRQIHFKKHLVKALKMLSSYSGEFTIADIRRAFDVSAGEWYAKRMIVLGLVDHRPRNHYWLTRRGKLVAARG
jgi:Mn-dependent DtxR family transcriptional regulator